MMEINHLRCFVAVAEELHFGRAAERLNMTQPPLSRRIQSLEQEVGCQLLDRTSRSVELTQAGKTLYKDAVRVLRLLEMSAISVKDVATGRTGLIRCGFTAASAYRFMPALVSRMNDKMPGVVLKLKEMMSRRQIAALESGEIDIALVRLPIDRKKFNIECIAKEEMQLVCSKDHVLAAKAEVQWSDLHDIDFIQYDRDDAPHFHELLASLFRKTNIMPRVRQELAQIHTVVSLVGKGIGVALVPESAGFLDRDNVVLRSISSDERIYVELYIAWRKDNQNPMVDTILDIARKL